jgi:hypothetical protein
VALGRLTRLLRSFGQERRKADWRRESLNAVRPLQRNVETGLERRGPQTNTNAFITPEA